MKYCHHCGTLTPGQPLFCGSCGRTYDVKLCSRLHVNPRRADVCSQCGSRDLSTPQPKMRFRDQVMSTFVMIVLGAVLFLGSLLVILAVLRAALTNAQVQGAVALTVILLVLLWWMWLQLPKWLRALFGRFFMRLRGKKGEHR